MQGVRDVDYECFRQSRRANLKGSFRAFITSRVQNLDGLVRPRDSRLPLVNLKVWSWCWEKYFLLKNIFVYQMI